MAEFLNLIENNDEILEKYDVEMEQYLEDRDRHIGTTAFEALAIELTKSGDVEAGLTNAKETPYGDGEGSSIDADWVDD